MDDLDDVVTATAATFLGLTVELCPLPQSQVRPDSQKDYYVCTRSSPGCSTANGR